jgi:hypothetical protein
MRMYSFQMAGGGGRRVHVNPDQVVCLVDMGDERTQVVTTGLSGQTSMTLIVEGALEDVARTLQGRAAPPRSRVADLMDMPRPGGSSLS